MRKMVIIVEEVHQPPNMMQHAVHASTGTGCCHLQCHCHTRSESLPAEGSGHMGCSNHGYHAKDGVICVVSSTPSAWLSVGTTMHVKVHMHTYMHPQHGFMISRVLQKTLAWTSRASKRAPSAIHAASRCIAILTLKEPSGWRMRVLTAPIC